MVESRATRILLRRGALVTLAFIYLPLFIIAPLRVQRERHAGVADREATATKWFSVAFHDEDVRDALKISILAALGATAIALVLGTLASLAVSRYRFFGREIITFAVILPIALPGIITGLALQATIIDVLEPLGISFGLCDDRHRPRDLLHRRRSTTTRSRGCAGPPARSTRRRPISAPTAGRRSGYVMLPQMRTALLAGWLARVRALVRRGDRHGLHVGRRADAADLDLHEPRATRRAADHQRRRALRHHRLDRSGLLRDAARRADGLTPSDRGRSTVAASIEAEPRRQLAAVTPTPIGHETPVPPSPQ